MPYNRWAGGLAAVVATATVVVSGTLAGCSNAPAASGSGPTHTPVGQDVPTVLDTRQLRLPLDTYQFTVEQVAERSAAHRELIRRCMNRFGIQLTLPEPAPGGPHNWNERRYGLTDQAAAASIGYGFPGNAASQRDPRGQAPALGDKALAVLSGEGSKVPSGVPQGGCQGEATRRLALLDPATRRPLDEGLPQRLSLETFQRSQTDPAVRAAFSDWSSCMRAKGHTYNSPLDPPADRGFQPPGSSTERQTAQDDVACKISTNLVGRWYAVEAAYQTELIQQQKAELTALAAAMPATNKIVRQVNESRGSR